jgi:hypothetical protein
MGIKNLGEPSPNPVPLKDKKEHTWGETLLMISKVIKPSLDPFTYKYMNVFKVKLKSMGISNVGKPSVLPLIF